MLEEDLFEDNLENLLTKLGSDVDPTIHKITKSCPQNAVDWFSNGGIAQKISTFWAQQMGTGIEIEVLATKDNSLNAKRSKELSIWIEGEVDRLNILPLFIQAETQCAISNGAPMLMLTSGEERLFEPPSMFESIDKVLLLDPLQYIPDAPIFSHRGGVDLSQVEYYYNRQTRLGLHKDRVLPLTGQQLFTVETSTDMQEKYWGKPLIGSAIINATIAYDAAIKYAEMLLAKKNFIAMKLTGFSEGMNAAEPAKYANKLHKVIKAIQKAADILSVHLFDAKDEIAVIERNLAGVQDVIIEIKYYLLAQCLLIPEAKLFGRSSVGGLAISSNEEEDVDGEAARMWAQRWLPLLRHIVKLLLMGSSCPYQGWEVSDIKISRVRGYNSSPIDDARARLLVAQAVKMERENELAEIDRKILPE